MTMLSLPIVYFQNPMKSVSTKLWTTVTGLAKRIYTPFQLNDNIVAPIKRKFTLVYSRDKDYLYVTNENLPFKM